MHNLNDTHTPGPWVADKYGNVMPYPGTGHICACSLRGDHLEMMENARLIAEAPAMLAALRAALDQLTATSAWEDALRGEDQAMLDAVSLGQSVLTRIEGAGA